jgi:alpha-mannosidase
LPAGFQGAVDADGEPLPVQQAAGRLLAEVSVPACGWTTVRPASATATASSLRVTERLLENELLRLTFNERGEITSIIDKTLQAQGRGGELAAGPCNSFRMYKDVPTWFDAWDIDSNYELLPVALDEPATIEVVSAGPLAATLRVTRKLHDSLMTQEISLRRGSRRVDFVTRIDWQERHKLLKVAFPVEIHANEAIHEIQFGHIRRPNHRSRPFDGDRFEVSNHRWTALAQGNQGVAVLNDSKYGVNVLDTCIALTLLKSAMAPDMHADQGIQEFTYSFYAWDGPFATCDVVRQGYDLNCPALVAPGDGGAASLFIVDAANVVIDAVKPAEDGTGDVVVRLYEAMQMAGPCTLSTSLPVVGAGLTDMLENPLSEAPCENGRVALMFRPFEVKTLRLRL